MERLTGNETHEEVAKLIHDLDWKRVVDFLHYDGKHYKALNIKERLSVWVLGNGFGEVTAEFIVKQLEFDWSHIRDSDNDAVGRMSRKIQLILSEKAHPGHTFCGKCLDSGLHL